MAEQQQRIRTIIYQAQALNGQPPAEASLVFLPACREGGMEGGWGMDGQYHTKQQTKPFCVFRSCGRDCHGASEDWL